MDPIEINRLKWKCRRGLLELDLILEKYLGKNPADPLLSELLDLPDKDLLDIVMCRSEGYAPHLNEIVARLRAA